MRNALLSVPDQFREKVQTLIKINEQYARQYFDQLLFLEEYRRHHPTKIIVFKCSDGRILFSHFTGTPLGYLRNFRNLGGQFNFGWIGFQTAFMHHVQEAHNEGNGCMAIVTYHKSKSDNKKLGCAANEYDLEKSIKNAFGFAKQIRDGYKDVPYVVYPNDVYSVVIGIETDEDALILHSYDNSKTLDLSRDVSIDISPNEMLCHIKRLHPMMPVRMCLDLLPLLMNNVKHCNEVKNSSRPITELDHNEWVVGVGGSSAFDWFHKPNVAILVGLHNPNIARPIEKALGVIKKHNAKNGFILLSGASFGNSSHPKSFAYEGVKYYSRLAQEVVKDCYPELKEYMCPLRILLDLDSQRFEIV